MQDSDLNIDFIIQIQILQKSNILIIGTSVDKNLK